MITKNINDTEKLRLIKGTWDEYVPFLKAKYPAKEGEKWAFTCPHHQRINDLLEGKAK